MDELKYKQRTIAQIMADAALMDRARREHEVNQPPRANRAARLSFLRDALDPRWRNA